MAGITITDNLPTTIGKHVKKAYPQDVKGEAIYVRIGSKSRRVLEVLTFDEALDRDDVVTGKAPHASEWVAPYCFECGDPKLTQHSILCGECNHAYGFMVREEFGHITGEGVDSI